MNREPRNSTPGFVYSDNRRFLNAYTNDGYLMGSWIGRAGRGGQGWLTYWLSPRNKVQLGYRLQGVSHDFIQGGRVVDYSAQSEFMVGPNVAVSGLFQYEQWKFPVLSPTRTVGCNCFVAADFLSALAESLTARCNSCGEL